MWWSVITLFLMLPLKIYGRMDCSKAGYDRCIRIADPLVREAQLIFPDNENDISIVCKTWDRFVDCLNLFTDECFTDQQKRQFNKAVESPIESVHKMCTQTNYRKEYLLHAPCIKNTIIERRHCGLQYNLLVEQVDQGDIISKSTLCCSHDRFKQCVEKETRRLCDRGLSNGPATTFATQIIDKALRFLQEQCVNYIPNSGDCISTPTDSVPYADRSEPVLISTASSEVYPWSTIQQESKEIPLKITPQRPTTWLPSTNKQTEPPEGDRSLPNPSTTQQVLGSRTRPASYGRASSWSESSTVGNTVPMISDVSSTAPSWGVSNSAFPTREGVSASKNEQVPNANNYGTTPSWMLSSTSTETWYPAAGNQINNEVDEPNQLGLKKPKNFGEKVKLDVSCLVFVVFIVFRM